MDDTFERQTGPVNTAIVRSKTVRCEATDFQKCRIAPLFYRNTKALGVRSWIWTQIPFEARAANSKKGPARRAPRSPESSVALYLTAEAAHECLSPRV
jgi:hypothetical protein